jgi:hypothetical protein
MRHVREEHSTCVNFEETFRLKERTQRPQGETLSFHFPIAQSFLSKGNERGFFKSI